MKKILCVLLALTSVFCFAGCKDGRCDECKSNKDVREYDLIDGDTAEYCPSCTWKNILDIRGEVDD